MEAPKAMKIYLCTMCGEQSSGLATTIGREVHLAKYHRIYGKAARRELVMRMFLETEEWRGIES